MKKDVPYKLSAGLGIIMWFLTFLRDIGDMVTSTNLALEARDGSSALIGLKVLFTSALHGALVGVLIFMAMFLVLKITFWIARRLTIWNS